MAALKNLVSDLPLSRSIANVISSHASASINNVYHSDEVPVLETHRAFEGRISYPAFDPTASSGKSISNGTDSFVSNTTKVLDGDAYDFGFSSISAPAVDRRGWSVEEMCGVALVMVIVPFILAGNLLVVFSVFRFKRLQMPTNYFIVSLAAVDVFVAIVTPFFVVMEVLNGQVENPVLYLAPNRILMTACGVSVLTLAAIAYDRHTALVSPLKYVSVMTIRKIGVVVTFTWVYSALIVWAPLPLGWFLTHSSGSGEVGSSSFQRLHDNAHILFLSAIFGPACIAITVCYFRIYTVARHHARAIAAVENSVQHNLRVRFMIKDAKYAKTLALVIGVFLVLWTPYLGCLLAEVVSPVRISPWLWNYLTLLAVLNSGLNPWIYAFKNNEFRTAFRKIFKLCCSMGNNSICLRLHKDWRRCSGMSDANVFATTITSTCNSRMSRLSHGSATPTGRMSDVSCIINIGPDDPENVNKMLSLRPGESVGKVARTSLPSTLDSDDLLRSSLSKLTEQRVSTLLNSDSRVFIADLLSVYLHHSLMHKDVDAVSRSELSVPQDGNGGHHDVREYCDSGVHTDHSYLSDHSHYSHIDLSDHSDSSNTDHKDCTEQSDLSDLTEQGYYSDVTDHSCHGDSTDRGYYSDHTEPSDHSDHMDHRYHVHRVSQVRSDHSSDTAGRNGHSDVSENQPVTRICHSHQCEYGGWKVNLDADSSEVVNHSLTHGFDSDGPEQNTHLYLWRCRDNLVDKQPPRTRKVHRHVTL